MSSTSEGSQSHHVRASTYTGASCASPGNLIVGVGTAVPTRRTVTEHASRPGTETRNSRLPPGTALHADA